MILQVVGDGRPGGGTTAVLGLSRLLLEQGHGVTIVTQRGSYLADEAARHGIDAVGVDFSSRMNTPALTLALRRLIGRLGASVVHAHGARAALPAITAGRTLRCPPRLIYTVHGFHYVAAPPVRRGLGRAAEAWCIALADATNFVSDGDCQIAQEEGFLARARDHRIIKNAVSVQAHLADTPKNADIGFLGRLVPQKNPLILVDILLAMRPLRPLLHIIGGGALEPQLRERIARHGLSDQVVIHGEKSRNEALRLAASCRVLVLPSRWEGHPIALIEAMGLGLPVVASDVSGSREIVVHGQTGYLVPVEDAAAYARSVTTLLGNPALLASMRKQALQSVARDYSPERMLAAHLALYGMRSGPASGGVLEPVR